MIYDTYNENSSLFPNQTVQGRANSLYVNEDVPVLPRRYHEKLREGDETKNKKRIYPEDKFPDLYKKDEESGGDEKDPAESEDPEESTP